MRRALQKFDFLALDAKNVIIKQKKKVFKKSHTRDMNR